MYISLYLCPVRAEIFNRTSHLKTGQSGSKLDTWQPYVHPSCYIVTIARGILISNVFAYSRRRPEYTAVEKAIPASSGRGFWPKLHNCVSLPKLWSDPRSAVNHFRNLLMSSWSKWMSNMHKISSKSSTIFFSCFYRATLCVSAVFAVTRCPSICLSVRLTVC